MNHKIYIPKGVQKKGQNLVVVEFESSYVTTCEGFQYYKDSGDGTEYVYTELEPDHCHKFLPCFDQPDLKAPQKLLVLAEEDWEIISNSAKISKINGNVKDKEFGLVLQRFGLGQPE